MYLKKKKKKDNSDSEWIEKGRKKKKIRDSQVMQVCHREKYKERTSGSWGEWKQEAQMVGECGKNKYT